MRLSRGSLTGSSFLLTSTTAFFPSLQTVDSSSSLPPLSFFNSFVVVYLRRASGSGQHSFLPAFLFAAQATGTLEGKLQHNTPLPYFGQQCFSLVDPSWLLQP
eukprot:766426-Hanusia_phi.AAC.2